MKKSTKKQVKKQVKRDLTKDIYTLKEWIDRYNFGVNSSIETLDRINLLKQYLVVLEDEQEKDLL